MRYYLDTNILIFILSNDKDEFSTQVLDVLEDYSNMFYLSAVVLKELILLYKEGKLKHLKYKTYKDIFDIIDSAGFKINPIQRSNLFAYAELIPGFDHKDPNDHLIIAQSTPIKFRLFLLMGSLNFTKVKVYNSYLTNDNVFDNEKTNFAFNGNDFHNRFFVGMYQSFSG